jgi:hypothetical protein
MFEANSRFDQAVNGTNRINAHGHVRDVLASSSDSLGD